MVLSRTSVRTRAIAILSVVPGNGRSSPRNARRFGHSTQFGGARGYEVTASLSRKGGRFSLRDPWPLFADEELRHYKYEDERYWAWYRLFGRLGYSTDADSDVWEREFERRFGEAAPHVEEAYRAASEVLSLITAAHLTRHPANVNWTEMDTGGALFAEHSWNDSFGETTYANAEPSDPGLFYGIDEFVANRQRGDLDRRYTPLQVAGWYEHLAREVRSALSEAGELIDGDTHAEYRATRLDMLNLADLADYHARKTGAALYATIATVAGEIDAFTAVHRKLDSAREAWADLAERAERAYDDDVLFGRDPDTGGQGTWSDRLEEIDRDLERLAEQKPDDPTERPTSLDSKREPLFSPTALEVSVPDRVSAGDSVAVTLHAGEFDGIRRYRLHYRHTDQTEGAFRTVDFEQRGETHHAYVPADYVTPEWDFLAYVSALDANGEPVLLPGLYHATEPEPYYVVEVIERQTG